MTKTNIITKLTGALLAFALAMSFIAPAAAALEAAEPAPNQPIVEEAIETISPEPSDPAPDETVIEPASQPETETPTDNVAPETTSEESDKLIGQDGNIFNLIGIAQRTLRKNGMADEAKEMYERINTEARDYSHALWIIGEYVNITGPGKNMGMEDMSL